MTKKLILTLTVAALAMMVAGCGNDEGTQTPIIGPAGMLTSAIPAGAVLESATLNLYVWQVSNQTVNVHRATDYWEEMTVTWNSFGGAYAATVDGAIPVTAETWTSTDVTALVQAWLDGTYANHGFLLEQGTAIPRSIFFSRDYVDLGKVPYLEVCYYEGGDLVCEQLPAIADSDIWELNPDDNWGAAHTLRAGWDQDVDWTKMTLIQFDLPQAPPDDCAECDGKITALNLEFQGAAEAYVEVFAKGKRGATGEVLFAGNVLPGGNFDIIGHDRRGTVGTEIYLWVDGVFNTQIHTSCSQPIYIGMVSGAFEILDGYSRFGGRLCPGDGGGNGGGDECSECDGRITELTLAYNGAAEATVEVYSKGKRHSTGKLLFSGQVLPGGSFNFVGQDRKGTVGTEIKIFVDGVLNTKIHTSCSQPIYIGMVSGDFEILDGYSKNGGQLCQLD